MTMEKPAATPVDPRPQAVRISSPGSGKVTSGRVPATLPDTKPMAFSATPSLIDTVMPTAPERYGKYHLLERIGVGGMAEVWRAKTLGSEGFTKDLVIKRILPKFTNDEESVRMFIDEARLVAKLHHPNIVQIFDFDKEGDRYYLAMELIEGRDLRQAEKSAAKAGVWFPIAISIYLVSEALKGLHYAHSRQDHGKPLEIVHRDVSPHNILISYSGDVKISDFGIAKVAERASSTTSGTVKGKLAYMSPEQITGQPLDGRTDIYSMGIVFWELLTRHRLFFGPDEHDVVRRVRDGIVPPPRQYNPEIPEEVEKIVMKMLVANRNQRYQSAGEVARQLCSLPQYAYEAQPLGEFMRTLFPEQNRNWTQMLQNMLNPPPAKASNGDSVSMQVVVPADGPPIKEPSAAVPPPSPTVITAGNASGPASAPPAPRSPMAGSEQKTQIATELPPQVASALAAAQGAPPGQGGAPNPATGARTMIASAPQLPPGGPPPGAPIGPPPGAPGGDARTVMASAPVLPPPGGGPGPGMGREQATVMAMPAPTAQPMTQQPIGAPGAPVSMQRPGPAPIALRPASAVFGAATQSAGMSPNMKWIIGPAITIVVAILTTFIANRIWPPETGSGGGGPSILAAKRTIRIESDPPKADVQVDGVTLAEKTPTEITGDIGKSSHIRVLLQGYDPYDANIAFTKDARPPLKVRLFKAGTRQKQIDNSAYDERPDVSPKGEDGEGDKTAAKGEKTDKTEKTDKPEKGEKGEKPEKGEKTDKVAAKGEKKPETGEEDEDEAGKHKGGHKKPEGADAKKAKATLTILVRPWAIVYVDGKKIQQTPLRNYPISVGNHKLLLVNDTKGKREEIKLKVTAGEAIPEIKRTWE